MTKCGDVWDLHFNARHYINVCDLEEGHDGPHKQGNPELHDYAEWTNMGMWIEK